jgi:hypothetical protein
MGYQRGERGRLASLITVVILGTAVVSIDHISGRSIQPPARSEAANQVISMDLAGSNPAEVATMVRSDEPQCSVTRCNRQSRPKRSGAAIACREATAVTNSLKLKARELQDTDWPVLARLSGITKKASFLELEKTSIPPLERRLIMASQVTSVKSVSIRLEGEVKISKGPAPAPTLLYMIRATGDRVAHIRERSFRSEPVLVLPTPTSAWKCSKSTS